MAYRLTVADVIEFPVKVSVNDAGRTAVHQFHLTATRIPQEEAQEVIKDGERPVRELLLEKVTGWRGQKLVVDDDGQPAGFSAEAFGCLLSLAGLPMVLFQEYLKALVVSSTEGGRAKN